MKLLTLPGVTKDPRLDSGLRQRPSCGELSDCSQETITARATAMTSVLREILSEKGRFARRSIPESVVKFPPARAACADKRRASEPMKMEPNSERKKYEN